MKKTLLAGLSLLALQALPALAGPDAAEPEIPYARFVLDNGLTLLVHEDHKAPIVAVNVWYHVGSKNEKPGKTGFAHLFEHLMFNGSEHFNDDYFKAAEKVGATDLNGTTNEDRTNYFQNAPKEALDTLLWLESDRMAHLLGALTQERLDEQRGVVQNEKRQYENQPYAIAYELITKNIWPAGHPYSWPVIGSMEDLNAATLEDVREWFKTYYGAANATLAIAGDVTPQEALEKVERFFGSVPPGPPLARHAAWIAKRSGTQRQRVADRVPHARLYKVWNIPNYGTDEGRLLELAGGVLAGGKTSRLYRRLVYDDRIATEVSAYAELREIAGTFTVSATAAAGIDLSRIEKAVDEELARFLKEGPSPRELRRVKAEAEAGFIRGIERIGGFGGKSDQLAMGSVFLGAPDHYKADLKGVREATAKQLRDAARAWLSDGQYVLEVRPFAGVASGGPDVDRRQLPVPEIRPEARFPSLQRATLSNGLKVVLAERPSIPVVQFSLLVDAGFAADQAGSPGTARLATEMLAEGTRRRSALEISEELELLGARLGAGCSLDTCTVSLNTLRKHLDAALDVYAEVIVSPAFRDADFLRRQEQRLADIRREKAEPVTTALRVLPPLLYGAGHAYGTPFTGTGTEASVARLSPADLSRFHAAWFRPNNATLVVAGDTTLAEITPKLERLFGAWKAGGVPRKDLAAGAQPPAAPSVTVIDKPGALQSVIFVGNLAPPKGTPSELAMEMLDKLLGGDFTSRINMNLREDKHWTYRARTSLIPARGPQAFWASVQVQADKTREAMRELEGELSGILGPRPVTDAELARVVTNQSLKQPGAWETIASVADALSEIVVFGLRDDTFQTLPERLRALTADDVRAAAAAVVRPQRFVWVVVGDRARIEAGIRELNLGELRFADADGRLVGQ